MAALNILAVSDKEIHWSKLLNEIQVFNLIQIEMFPIPKQLGFNLDSIGICLPSGFDDREDAVMELLKLSHFLNDHNFELTELYNGTKVTKENAKKMFITMLS
jgi:hypothetical protein